MNLAEIVAMLENRLLHNDRERAAAFARGDVAVVAQLDQDIASTAASLAALRPLID
jgi:hypothetical protein